MKIKLTITHKQLVELNDILLMFAPPNGGQKREEKLTLNVWGILSIKIAKKLLDKRFYALQKEICITLQYWEACFLEIIISSTKELINPDDTYKHHVAHLLITDLNKKLA